ncbi:hypothetical protein [Paramicrobacterium chengjingii]|uniref:Antitoxin VbhA domain-containing protein n=1 Tax=Paramicrobacterium chengjingii TaxID=2769067 RepID=A0ABX6YLW8_9MICO|nr:hypothetical protein [Microbacterium chengjingii]QPZ39717.1 hypothetical protein HCR76_06640 [Microbacterium chengjingii]
MSIESEAVEKAQARWGKRTATAPIRAGFKAGYIAGASREVTDEQLAQVRAEAWDQGYGDCWNWHMSQGAEGNNENPYRALADKEQ